MILASEYKNESGFKILLNSNLTVKSNVKNKKSGMKDSDTQSALEKYEEGMKDYQSRITDLFDTIEFKENRLLSMNQEKENQAIEIEALKEEL